MSGNGDAPVVMTDPMPQDPEQEQLDVVLDRVLGKDERMRRTDWKLQAGVFGVCAITAVWCFFSGIPGITAAAVDSATRWLANFLFAIIFAFAALYECPATSIAALQPATGVVADARESLDEWFRVFALLLGRGVLYINIGLFLALGYEFPSGQGVLGITACVAGAALLAAHVVAAATLKKERGAHREAFKLKYDAEENRRLFQQHAGSDGMSMTKEAFQNLYRSHAVGAGFGDGVGTGTHLQLSEREWRWLCITGDDAITYDEFSLWLHCAVPAYAPAGMYLPSVSTNVLTDPRSVSVNSHTTPSAALGGSARQSGYGSISGVAGRYDEYDQPSSPPRGYNYGDAAHSPAVQHSTY